MKSEALRRWKTGFPSVDRLLGGGLVADSLVLLAGEPGVGKSTLLLQLLQGLTDDPAFKQSKGKILYASGEESIAQIQDRAERLSVKGGETIYLKTEHDLDAILDDAYARDASILVVDSMQTLTCESHPTKSAHQVTTVVEELMRFAKKEKRAVIVIGQILKDGDIAGPKSAEHLVDAVFLFQKADDETRKLSATKNRFGSTSHKAQFKMTEEGLEEQ